MNITMQFLDICPLSTPATPHITPASIVKILSSTIHHVFGPSGPTNAIFSVSSTTT
jgi:hypothetical protein